MGTTNKIKRQPAKWQKYLKIMCGKGLIFRIYKEPWPFNNRKKKKLIKKNIFFQLLTSIFEDTQHQSLNFRECKPTISPHTYEMISIFKTLVHIKLGT